jgi:hypothetical protein
MKSRFGERRRPRRLRRISSAVRELIVEPMIQKDTKLSSSKISMVDQAALEPDHSSMKLRANSVNKK